MTENPKHSLSIHNPILCDALSGLATGTFIAGAFNPWDRALYLSSTNHRPFLFDGYRFQLFYKNPSEYHYRFGMTSSGNSILAKLPGLVFENFQNPYDRIMQSMFSRTVSGGMYFFMQSQMNQSLYVYLAQQRQVAPWQAKAAVGLVAGGVAGAVSNWLYVIRAYSWDHGTHFFQSAYQIYYSGGMAPFMKGIGITLLRDTKFGVCNELLRYVFRDKPNHFFWNIVAGSCAAIVSGPANYVRNKKFQAKPDLPIPTTKKLLSDLWNESLARSSVLERLHFFQQRLNVGWGTLRVGVGMAAGQKVFEVVKSRLNANK